jgi:hypothetical protein
MIEEFSEKLRGKTKTPWNKNLFKVDPNSKHLKTKQAKVFHTFVMKGMFLCKRGRQDIQPAVAFMATSVTECNEGDWTRLVKMMNYLKATKDAVLCISADDTSSYNQVACRCRLCRPQGHEKSHWSRYDSWLWYYLLHLYETES